MEKNFTISKGVELWQGKKWFDIHNCYYFSGFHLEAREAFLSFEPHPKWGRGLPPVVIKFSDLVYWRFDFAPGTVHEDYDRCKAGHLDVEDWRAGYFQVDEMGYKNPDDFGHDWLLTESQSNYSDHFLFWFVGGQSIRLFASRAEVKEGRMHVDIIEVSSKLIQ